LSGPTDKIVTGRILGIDESGKGDFFGALVIAGVVADDDGADRLRQKGIKDSKTITDKKILELSGWITENYVHSVVIIGPEKYNQLYHKIKNLNRLLAWGHSRVIENIAAETKLDLVISDKFGRDDFIEKALMENGKQIPLKQMVRGEAVVQVAAASIVARAAFVKFMAGMKNQYGLEIPKGGGSQVDEAGRRMVLKFGPDILEKTAKVHFKNYKKIMG